jgi:hypothetical protein
VYDPFAPTSNDAHGSPLAAELKRLASHYGFSLATGVSLTYGFVSADIDHVVVDRYGVLVIDAEAHSDAVIIGSVRDNKWMATFADGRATEFPNPARQGTGAGDIVRQALGERLVILEPGQISSAVVFVGADISRLMQVEDSPVKIVSLERVADMFEDRYNFPPNSGLLTGADVARIASTISSLADVREGDADTRGPLERDPIGPKPSPHTVVAPPPPTHAEDSGSLSAELAGHFAGVSEGPSLRAALLTMGTIFLIVLTLLAGVLFYPQLQAAHPSAWTAALVLLVGLAELVAANLASIPRNARKIKRGGLVSAAARLALRLLFVFVFVTVMWVLIAGGGAERVAGLIAEQFQPSAPGSSTSAKPPINPGVVLAKRRLKEKAPDVFRSARNLDSPETVFETAGRISYTWEYTPDGGGASDVASYTLTLDLEGKVVDR